jgi:flavin reductase (DIM6/NTAB) family NADH-FMN oxidoreductase RutF
MYFSKKDIELADQIKRLNIINSITGVKSANLIATISDDGVSNVAIFSSVIHLGSSPALLGFIVRPVHPSRSHTYYNIQNNGYFTINHIHREFAEKAHYSSGKFKQDQSEFKYCGLKEEYLNDFKAPFVNESKLKIGLKLVETINIKSNGCFLVVGSIEHLHIPDEIVNKTGHIDLQSLETLGIGGLDTYYELNRIYKFPYLKKT